LLAACHVERAPDDLRDGAWKFEIDRVWLPPTGGVSDPNEAFDEADYDRDVLSESNWTATFSGDLEALELRDTGIGITSGVQVILGVQGDPVGVRAHYDLADGAFAGGRFEVWDTGGLQAELTIYGSGVPVVSSARGALRPIDVP
jgi:hypothetical protein